MNMLEIEDPVAEVGRQIVGLVAALHENDDAQLKASGTEGTLLENEADRLYDHLDSLEGLAGIQPAKTMARAMLHVALARGDAESILGWVKENDPHRRDAERTYLRIERCLYSVLSILVQASGADPAKVGAEYYMPAALDPHQPREMGAGRAEAA